MTQTPLSAIGTYSAKETVTLYGDTDKNDYETTTTIYFRISTNTKTEVGAYKQKLGIKLRLNLLKLLNTIPYDD